MFNFTSKQKDNLVYAYFRLEATIIYSVGDFGSVVRHEDGALSMYIRICYFQIAEV